MQELYARGDWAALQREIPWVLLQFRQATGAQAIRWADKQLGIGRLLVETLIYACFVLTLPWVSAYGSCCRTVTRRALWFEQSCHAQVYLVLRKTPSHVLYRTMRVSNAFSIYVTVLVNVTFRVPLCIPVSHCFFPYSFFPYSFGHSFLSVFLLYLQLSQDSVFRYTTPVHFSKQRVLDSSLHTKTLNHLLLCAENLPLVNLQMSCHVLLDILFL